MGWIVERLGYRIGPTGTRVRCVNSPYTHAHSSVAMAGLDRKGEHMAELSRPRVAVIGGFYALDEEPDPKLGVRARAYAEELGRDLAEAGFGLVVYFSNDKSLEPYVVRGFVAALPADEVTACIDVRYSEAQRGLVEFDEQAARPKLFKEDAFPGQNWEAPFYRSLAARDSVDAVLLMSGGASTLNAGQVAVGRGLPLLAIDKFPGAAQVLRTELATRVSGYPSSQGAEPARLVAWLREEQSKEAQRLREALKRDSDMARITSQQRGAAWFAFALIGLLGTLACGLLVADTPRWFLLAMGGTLVSAGATGALVRGLTTTSVVLDPKLAALLGVLAGLFVGLAYLIPQLIGAPELLDPGATDVKQTDKIQLLSVTLVAFTAGIGFDTIFRRVQIESEKVPINITR